MFQALENASGRTVAIKIVRSEEEIIQEYGENVVIYEEVLNAMQIEIHAYQSLKPHPNIIEVIGIDSSAAVIVMEMGCTDLKTWIRSRAGDKRYAIPLLVLKTDLRFMILLMPVTDLETSKLLMKDILSAVHHMHQV